MYKKRIYRTNLYNPDLVYFKVKYFESNLLIGANSDLKNITDKILRKIHTQILEYCQENPEFAKSLSPIKINKGAHPIIKLMQRTSLRANVGPMATVAGAVAEMIGKRLLKYSNEVLIENGGDIFISTRIPRKIGIFAGIGNIYNHLSIKINPEYSPCGICTSSGKFGHSLSLGISSATIVIAKSSALADAYATAIANLIKTDTDITMVLKEARRKKEIRGLVIITSSKMAAYGNFTFDVLDK